jgi:hypothetical protein
MPITETPYGVIDTCDGCGKRIRDNTTRTVILEPGEGPRPAKEVWHVTCHAVHMKALGYVMTQRDGEWGWDLAPEPDVTITWGSTVFKPARGACAMAGCDHPPVVILTTITGTKHHMEACSEHGATVLDFVRERDRYRRIGQEIVPITEVVQ